ncbi:YceI family protein [Pararobbsia silviterrae]|uniref:Polyisoprenoid-binding protein n=1 Tax=Pararobbsia silviterrae TaxID=1792498 RepID=A0A494YAV5_9BURK|nr:YceI family protein [Pararobbsia silviterrae]RKP58880.1 polyisoprenoid-binding protein [Pararobbsia silviterrae]
MFSNKTLRTLTLSMSVLAAATAFVSPARAGIDAAKSTLTATFKQMNVPVDASFKKISATIQFDPANLTASKAQFDVDVASIDLGSPEYNDQVAGKDWFDAKDFPHATFVSNAIKAGANGAYSVTGTLTIRGKSNTVVVPVQYHKDGSAQVFDGVLPIKRLQYGVGQGEWSDTSLVADDVQLKFHIVSNGQ